MDIMRTYLLKFGESHKNWDFNYIDELDTDENALRFIHVSDPEKAEYWEMFYRFAKIGDYVRQREFIKGPYE